MRQSNTITHHTSCYIMHYHATPMRHASHMQHHTSYNTPHAASCIDHTAHAPTAWYFDTTCTTPVVVNNCRVGDRSKTNCRACIIIIINTITTSTIIIIIIIIIASFTATSVTKQCTQYLADFRRPDDRVGRPRASRAIAIDNWNWTLITIYCI